MVNRAPAREIAERLAPLFSGIALPALVASIEHYQRLGCWGGDAAIDPALYESALDVFTHAKAITRRHASEGVVVAPPDA